jgi:hypothetical protein
MRQPYFVEVFTWRDASIPDSDPSSARALWTHPRLEVAELTDAHRR